MAGTPSEGRLLSKLALIRRLYERGYECQAILDLFRFIDRATVIAVALSMTATGGRLNSSAWNSRMAAG